MTTEELTAASLPAEPVVQNPEGAQPPKEEGSPAASGSRSHEDGEVRTDDEDVMDVDADVKDLIKTRPTGPLPSSLVFRESKVTANMIRDYEKAGFFPSGTGRAPLDEQTPTPEDREVVVFRDFFTCGLRFPCDLGCFFSEDPSPITNVFPGSVQVHLDHEDLRMQPQRRCFLEIFRVGHSARCDKCRRWAVLRSSLCMLHFQHPTTEHPKRDHANSDRALLQNQLH
jgi:hypothetical protein